LVVVQDKSANRRPVILLRIAFGAVWFVNFVGWLAFVGICILAFKLAAYFRELGKVVLAMWPPITVTVVAGVLLFYEGQGRDLGVGLLGEGHLKLFLLFWIFVYWAVNNGHSARLGLNRAFQDQQVGSIDCFGLLGCLVFVRMASRL
jgi:hypothetical protein